MFLEIFKEFELISNWKHNVDSQKHILCQVRQTILTAVGMACGFNIWNWTVHAYWSIVFVLNEAWIGECFWTPFKSQQK